MLAPFRLRRWVGGAMVGGGIAAMHYTGMAAFEVAGIILWDHDAGRRLDPCSAP